MRVSVTFQIKCPNRRHFIWKVTGCLALLMGAITEKFVVDRGIYCPFSRQYVETRAI
jgi:hypothetical protein